MRLRILAVVLPMVFLGMLPAVTRGHAFPDHSDPKVGSTVGGPPARVRIWFNADLEPVFSTIMVHTMDGEMIDNRDGRVNPSDPTLLEVSVPALRPGSYLVIWTAVSRDGHRTNGNFMFTVK